MKVKWDKLCGPGNGSSKTTKRMQEEKTWFSSVLSKRELGILVNTELSVSHQGKVTSGDADALSTSL